ncbi:hypothetical protein BN871_BX_00830 [Paenibacillus sp. P22]|nr:hypothetical protein BN871_BX_00830 [Paenibacillus sp. P22]
MTSIYKEIEDTADRILTVSDSFRAYLAPYVERPEEIGIIANGFDERRFKPISHENAVPQLITVCRLVPAKGIDILLHACAELKAKGHPFVLHIIGDGPIREELEALALSLDLYDDIIFYGYMLHPEEFMPFFDVFVLPSRAEAFGSVFAEAALCWLALVGTDVGGIGEQIDDGVNGLLVPPDDPAALAAALERLVTDSTFRYQLARAAWDKAKKSLLPHESDIPVEAGLSRDGAGSGRERLVPPAPGFFAYHQQQPSKAYEAEQGVERRDERAEADLAEQVAENKDEDDDHVPGNGKAVLQLESKAVHVRDQRRENLGEDQENVDELHAAAELPGNAAHRNRVLLDARHMGAEGDMAGQQHEADAEASEPGAELDRLAVGDLGSERYEHGLGHGEIESCIQEWGSPYPKRRCVGLQRDPAFCAGRMERIEQDENGEQQHDGHDDAVDGKDRLHASAQHRITGDESDDEPGLVRDVPVLIKDRSRSGEHDGVDAEQHDKHEMADQLTDRAAEQSFVEILVGFGADLPGQNHHFGSEPDEKNRRDSNREGSPVAVPGEKLQDFLSGREAGSDDGAHIRKPDLQHSPCASRHFRRLRF